MNKERLEAIIKETKKLKNLSNEQIIMLALHKIILQTYNVYDCPNAVALYDELSKRGGL